MKPDTPMKLLTLSVAWFANEEILSEFESDLMILNQTFFAPVKMSVLHS